MTNNYVAKANRTNQKPHNMPVAEIRKRFIKVGWVGQYRQINPVVRLAPFFDKGPGPDIGR
jgi:hypothetical protein